MSILFPYRPTSLDLGPDWVNADPVVDPNNEMSADQAVDWKRQIAGAGKTIPLARLFTSGSVSAPDIDYRTEAWNPEGKTAGLNALPVPSRSAPGVYLVSWSASGVLNAAGEVATLDLQWAVGSPAIVDATPRMVNAWPASNRTVEVRCWSEIAGVMTPTDMHFLLQVG